MCDPDCLGLVRTGSVSAPSMTLTSNRPTLASTQLMDFFWTLESVLSYRATVIKTFKDMGRFTVNQVTLSTKDVLVLLHKWSLIERDTKLQGELKAIIEQHQAKDLMSKSTSLLPQPPGSPWSSQHACPLATVPGLTGHRHGNGVPGRIPASLPRGLFCL